MFISRRSVAVCAAHVAKGVFCAGLVLLLAAPAHCESFNGSNSWRWGGSAKSSSVLASTGSSAQSSLTYSTLASTLGSSSGTGSLSGYVFLDVDPNDGAMNTGDWAISDVAISLLRTGSTAPMIVYTRKDGSYIFTGLPAGTYAISMLTPCTKIGTAAKGSILAGGGSVSATKSAAIGVASSQSQFTNIQLGAGDHGVNFNFADLIYPIGAISKRLLVNTDGEIIHTVPEPGSLALLAAAGLVLAGAAWRRRLAAK